MRPKIVYSSPVTTPGPIVTIVEPPSLGADRFLDLIAPKLKMVDEVLRLNFRSEIKTIEDVGDHILQGGGKRLRPALLLLVSNLLRYEGRQDVVYGAILELIHTATLVHDDIIDEAAIRRGRTSINYRWGNHLTVLVGDYLYTHAMQMALNEGNLEILKLLSSVTIRMIEGEILGLEINGRADLSKEDYFEIVERKTAALFGACCRIPAMLVHASAETTEALETYGFNLGVCFQLTDDLLDFTSSTEVLGKPALSDLKEGKMTLPLILALARASEGERRAIERVSAEKSFASIQPREIIAIVERHHGIEQARDIARSYATRARKALNLLAQSPSREALEFGLDFVLMRDR